MSEPFLIVVCILTLGAWIAWSIWSDLRDRGDR